MYRISRADDSPIHGPEAFQFLRMVVHTLLHVVNLNRTRSALLIPDITHFMESKGLNKPDLIV